MGSLGMLKMLRELRGILSDKPIDCLGFLRFNRFTKKNRHTLKHDHNQAMTTTRRWYLNKW